MTRVSDVLLAVLFLGRAFAEEADEPRLDVTARDQNDGPLVLVVEQFMTGILQLSIELPPPFFDAHGVRVDHHDELSARRPITAPLEFGGKLLEYVPVIAARFQATGDSRQELRGSRLSPALF